MALILVLVTAPISDAHSRTDFDPGRARFTAAFGEVVNPYRELAVFVMPGQTVPIEVAGMPPGARFGRARRRWAP